VDRFRLHPFALLALVAGAALAAGCGGGGSSQPETPEPPAAATAEPGESGAAVSPQPAGPPEQTLGEGPLRPTDPSLFHPTYYPEVSELPPAQGAAPTKAQILERLLTFLSARDPALVPRARELFEAPKLVEKVRAPSLRAALVALLGTLGEPAIDFILGGDRFASITFGEPPGGAVAKSFRVGNGGQQIVVDARYKREDPILLSPLLAHEVLHSDGKVSDLEELVAFAVQSLVHMEQLATHPELGSEKTGLAQHLNAWVLARLNTRTPGTADLRLYVPGEISGGIFPGGIAIPHLASLFDPSAQPTPGNRYLEQMLDELAEPGASAPAAADFDPETIRFIDENQAALSTEELVQAAEALGLEVR
jgi:hypothetical protein